MTSNLFAFEDVLNHLGTSGTYTRTEIQCKTRNSQRHNQPPCCLFLDCLSFVFCSNTTLLKLQTVLFLLFSKFCASKLGVRLIYGCGLYTDVYGIRNSFGFLFKNTVGVLRDELIASKYFSSLTLMLKSN